MSIEYYINILCSNCKTLSEISIHNEVYNPFASDIEATDEELKTFVIHRNRDAKYFVILCKTCSTLIAIVTEFEQSHEIAFYCVKCNKINSIFTQDRSLIITKNIFDFKMKNKTHKEAFDNIYDSESFECDEHAEDHLTVSKCLHCRTINALILMSY